MAHVNIEIKARCEDHDRVRHWLNAHGADFKGTDHQVDTYFTVAAGRLKLRQGTIENSLIFYNRPDQAGPKQADVSLFRTNPAGGEQLHEILSTGLSVRVVVDKQREIYFIDNVKFHLDTVTELGRFIEIEAIDENGTIGPEKLRRQCNDYMDQLAVLPGDLINVSYSELLMGRHTA